MIVWVLKCPICKGRRLKQSGLSYHKHVCRDCNEVVVAVRTAEEREMGLKSKYWDRFGLKQLKKVV